MAYWIIVAAKDKKDPSVSGEAKWAKRKEDCFWGVPETARGAKEINAGDKALFYLGAPAKCLIGPVQVLSTIHNLTPKEKEMVMSFLIENNLEFGYNVASGGFYVLKKLTPSGHRKNF